MSKLVIVGPLPPPVHGNSLAMSYVVHSDYVLGRAPLILRAGGASVEATGRLSGGKLVRDSRLLMRVRKEMRARGAVLYLSLALTRLGMLRDAAVIRTATRAGNCVIHVHGGALRQVLDSMSRPERSWVVGALSRCRYAIVLSHSLAGAFDGILPPDRIRVIPNGVPDPTVPRSPRHNGRVVFVGNMLREKGVMTVLETIHELKTRDVGCDFVGDWPDAQLRREFDAKIDEWDLRDLVHVHGRVSEARKEQIIAEAAALVFPSQYPLEGQPLVVIEALRAARPAIVSAKGALAETINDGEDGFVLVDPAPADLAERVAFLLSDERAWKGMSDRAYEKYRALHTIARFTDAVADVLEETAKEGGV